MVVGGVGRGAGRGAGGVRVGSGGAGGGGDPPGGGGPGAKAPAAPGPPRLELGRRFLDVGELPPGSRRTASVAIRNAGGGRLVIRRVETGCRCVEASAEPAELVAGETGRLRLKVLTLKHRGQRQETLAVLSNDPAGARELAVRFEVAPELWLEPGRLHLGVVRPRQELRRRVQVQARGAVRAKLLYATTSSGWLTARLVDPPVGRGRPGVVDVSARAPAGAGTYRADLNISTAHGPEPMLRLPVVLCVSSSATVRPQRVEFGRVARGAGASREVRVTPGDGCALASATARPEVLDVRTGAGDGGEVAIGLALRPSVAYGPFRGELRLEITGREPCALSVPFAGYVGEE